MNHSKSKEKVHTKEQKSQPSHQHRSCLKRRTNVPQAEPVNAQTDRLSSGRVSFANPSSADGKMPSSSQSQVESSEKKRRSATFAKKAKEYRLAELTYFKDHAHDKEPTDE